MRLKKSLWGKLSATVPLSSWGCLPCSILFKALRISAALRRWQQQLVVMCIVALGLHTENTSDCGLAVKIDGGPRRGDCQTRLWWKWAPWRSGTVLFTPPWDSLATNFQLSIFFFLSLSFGICPPLSCYTFPQQTCAWRFGFYGQIEKIKRWPEGSHLILATDVRR